MNQVICTVDVVLLTIKDEGLMVALLARDQEPFRGAAALPGGYVHADADASASDAAMRVLRDKAGIVPPYLEQLSTFSGPGRDPRGWSVSIAHYALVPFELIARPELQLVHVDRLQALPFDHAAMVATAVERLRNKSQYSSLPCFLAGDRFTLPQLQRIYELLMGETLNKVSFRRKITEMDMLEAVEGEFAAAGAHRPAQLYRLKKAFRQRLMLLERGL
ncbi:MAG: NUDIX domain-containing protein [Pseudomonadota bacterium]